MGTAAGASQYEPSVAARAPTFFYAGASSFSAFPAPREVAGPLLWEKGSCPMGPQRRVGKNTFMGPLYQELMHEAEPWGLRRGRASTSPQLPHGPPRFFMQVPLAFLRVPAPREVAGPLLWEKGSCHQMGPQHRVWKIAFMGTLYKELIHEAEPWGLRRGRASTSPQLPHGPLTLFYAGASCVSALKAPR